MTTTALFFLVPFAPFALAPLLVLPGGRRWLPLAPWLPLAGLALLPYQGRVIEMPWLLLGTRLGIDAAATPLVILAVLAWTLAGWHGRRRLEAAGQPRFFCFWLLTWCGNLCVFVTLDAASFYAAYALMTFAAYGLVIHQGRPADYRAGRVYLTMAVLGEGLLILGLFLLAAGVGNPPLEQGPALVAASEPAMVIAVTMLVGFGVKMGLAGLHMWLPLAHPQAPVPASAVLSGVILKAGLMGWLRFLPHGEDGFEQLGLVLLAIGLATAFFGVAIGLMQQRMKSLLAYSSVSQMGLIAAILALGLLDPERGPRYVMLSGLFALHHGLAKSTLFLGADLVVSSPALARILLWIPAAALAGLPASSGALAKAIWKSSLPAGFELLEPWLIATSLATTLLMARLLLLAWPAGEARGWQAALPWLAALAASLAVPWSYVLATEPALALLPWRAAYLLDTAWPVLAGAALALLAARLFRRRTPPRVPEGDLLELLPASPGWPRLHAWRVPQWRWHPRLDELEASMRALAPALLAGIVLLGGAVLVALLLGR